ncbi:SRPBCC domain-containing protein [Kribbella sp. NPDC051770]|uniref:SRPBCC domain-containing protein n=1 Tax=Kribbella sp. NPDC051770 TaxID=3155413 RepID=UPI00342D160E
MSIEQDLAPLVKTVVVATTPDRAFTLFTADLGKWWPLATHSVRGEAATDVRLEGAVGGQIIEYDATGPVGSWGTVSDWDPPHTVAFTWHPGTDPKQAGHVTVHFRALGDETEVELTHTGWERRPDGAEARTSYDTGWTFVLGHFARFQ